MADNLDETKVEVVYRRRLELKDSQVEFFGYPFECVNSSRCNTPYIIACCQMDDDSAIDDMLGSILDRSVLFPGRQIGAGPCTKCKYQEKLPWGEGCRIGTTSCGTPSDEIIAEAKINGPTFNPYQFERASMPCSDAIRILADLDSFRVLNSLEVTSRCNNSIRLECCLGKLETPEGSALTPETVCGDYWGPTNVTGVCNNILQEYCDTKGKKSPECACLWSPFPIPQCQDQRCGNTNAPRLSTQFAECRGQFIDCRQYIQFDEETKNNSIIGSISQTCTGDYVSFVDAPDNIVNVDENVGVTQAAISVVVLVIIFIAIIVIAMFLYNMTRKNKIKK